MTQDGFAYAVHALVLLAKSPGSATSSFLAGSVNIHATCLRKVMAPLARAGLVRACQGREGGYRLARPAAEMSLAEIYEAVVSEPLLRPNPAAVNPRCPISVAMGPALAAIAADAEARFQEALARRSLADVANQIEVVTPSPAASPPTRAWIDMLEFPPPVGEPAAR
ncbi:MAG TPA: Rrf2 family transcriptional regulator [Thermomicrobiales bacterium]|nr:Rrf2 family transcriptional regulator [Thermomicrobiales bacterium]